MEGAIQTVKEFSPYGWGITVLVLVLTFYQENSNRVTPDFSRLEARIIALEKNSENVSTLLSTVSLKLSDLDKKSSAIRKITCASLTSQQKRMLEVCD